jgi:peptidoglycan DL-endopeptidase CwlO
VALALLLPALLVQALFFPNSAGAAPAVPGKPAVAPVATIASVTAKLTALSQQNEQLSEQTNLVVADVAAKQKALQAAQARVAVAAVAYRRAHDAVKQTLTAEYQSSSFSRTGALLNSSSGQDFIDQVTTLNLLAAHRADTLSRVAVARAGANAAQSSANHLLAAANAGSVVLQQQRAALAGDQSKFRALLATLSAQQVAAFNGRGAPGAADIAAAIAVHAGSPAAAAAVTFARHQVGKAYVYGAAGPSGYDCSGLTMASWAAGGVGLPHNAAAQSHYGKAVAAAALQPGDLLFYYHPIGHVTIYLGSGLMVSAPEPGENVKIVTVASFAKDFVSATRLT